WGGHRAVRGKSSTRGWLDRGRDRRARRWYGFRRRRPDASSHRPLVHRSTAPSGHHASRAHTRRHSESYFFTPLSARRAVASSFVDVVDPILTTRTHWWIERYATRTPDSYCGP